MMRLSRFGFALLLALSLLIGQQAAMLHALGHANAELAHHGDEHGPAPAPDCPDHSLYVPFAGALGSKAPVVPQLQPHLDQARATPVASISLPPRHAFNPRAPPASPV